MRGLNGLDCLFVGVWMGMLVGLRTGEMFVASAAGFAIMATAILLQDDAPPEVAGQLE